MHPSVHCNTIYNGQDIETMPISINTWMDKEVVVHTYNGIWLSHKKNEIMPSAATWMALKIIILNETGQKEKDKYHMIVLFLVFKKTSMLFSIAVVSVYIATNSVGEFPFFYTFSSRSFQPRHWTRVSLPCNFTNWAIKEATEQYRGSLKN